MTNNYIIADIMMLPIKNYCNITSRCKGLECKHVTFRPL